MEIFDKSVNAVQKASEVHVILFGIASVIQNHHLTK